MPTDIISDAIRKRTSFSTISVREYYQTLGDNPSCLEGAPVSLDWTYKYEKSVSLDEYENSRQQRRRRSELILGADERRKLLIGNGLPIMEVIRAEKLVALKNRSSSCSGGSQCGKINLQSDVDATKSSACTTFSSRKRSVASRAA
eukprot:CAMPEP_0171341882 /NCGR_PEP_ID=MMETSP0878-20121228/12394_1 /TAXON_ID=67004 /ORGANISM="Thalassiosira weissflogii, Strain CCMP1336" /LENGTH=145 /DNA_ID=CAMNT_0011844349 /DNA_START=102 /DNA_END=539 /DNA_ORIENTATION=+